MSGESPAKRSISATGAAGPPLATTFRRSRAVSRGRVEGPAPVGGPEAGDGDGGAAAVPAAAAGAPVGGPAAAGDGDAAMAAAEFPNITAPDGLLTYAEWGQHLRADYRHDKLSPDPPYNIGRATAVNRIDQRRTKEFCESEFFDYAKTLGAVTSSSEFRARMKAVVQFKIPRNTDEFKPLRMLDIIENGRIGIVMDAGTNITEELGAKNVITFGMCIDPACSPISRERKPIYYEPDERHFYIDLEGFGFDKSIIHGIWIADIVDGKRVKTAWVVGPDFPPRGADYRLYDPIRRVFIDAGLTAANFSDFEALRPHVDELGTKIINFVSGDYSGRETASTVPEMLGKTLGDTMIVASAMPSINGVPNPFYNTTGGERWKKLEDGNPRAGENPGLYVVKTGDILNAVRAIFKNVPVILEDHIEGIDYKQYNYYPGATTADGFLKALPSSYAAMIIEATARYDSLIAAFKDAVDRPNDPATVELKSGFGMFVETPGRSARNVFRSTQENRRLAGRLFYDICQQLEGLKTAVLVYFRERKRTVDRFEIPDGATADQIRAVDAAVAETQPNLVESTERPPKRARMSVIPEPGERGLTFKQYVDNYNADLEHLKNLCPQTGQILRDKRSGVMLPIIPITRTNGTINLNGNPVPDMEIRLLTAFQAIANAPDGRPPNYVGTVYVQRFTDRILALLVGGGGGAGGADGGAGGAGGADGGAAAAGEDDLYRDELEPYVRAIVGEPPAPAPAAARAAPAPASGGLEDLEGGQRGGANGAAGGAPADTEFQVLADAESGISAETFPLISLFIDYWQTVAGSVEEVETLFKTLFTLIRMRNSPRIASPFLLEEMEIEFHHLKETGAVRYPGDVIPADVEQTTSTISTLVYNAFTMAVNRANTMMYEGDTDIGFGYLEEEFKRVAADEVQKVVSEESALATPADTLTLETGAPPLNLSQVTVGVASPARSPGARQVPGGSPAARFSFKKVDDAGTPRGLRAMRDLAEEFARAGGNRRTPRRKNRKATYRLQKKSSK